MTEQAKVAKVLPEESLEQFLASMRDFNQAFIDAIVSGVDFTLKLEVHGDCGELLHAAVNGHSFRRPKGVEKRIEDRRRQKRDRRKIG